MFSSWTTLIGYDEDPLVATLATVNGKKQYRHTVGNVLDVLEACAAIATSSLWARTCTRRSGRHS